ncbi:Gfo/Idh/MocA family protein [Atopococcus tabaci]|uniref:Gfo/Idh/MocA family protein n=1 Tax=Atopococcus tabaci TaxID=269774 RepID=UPI000406B4B6|nr:Gfo/Idh/MocA family oxidoreductase [Atopococcus tabaci]
MKVGVIGLGNIAQKAYLPVMMTQHADIDWHLCTRNEEKLNEIAKQYRVKEIHTDLDELIQSGVDAVFIHTPTASHGSIIRKMLENDIHVYVDKPVSEDLKETRDLLALANERGKLLTVGFNRRFAPMIQELKEIPDKNTILFQKNQINQVDQPTRFRIYDMFIHPLDTALHMVDGDVRLVESRIIGTKDRLERAWVELETDDATIRVSVNSRAGAKEETMEVQSLTETVRVENLTEWTRYTGDKREQKTFSDWENTLTKRGFAPIIQAFLEAVRTGSDNPVSAKSAWLSHRICEEMLRKEGI